MMAVSSGIADARSTPLCDCYLTRLTLYLETPVMQGYRRFRRHDFVSNE